MTFVAEKTISGSAEQFELWAATMRPQIEHVLDESLSVYEWHFTAAHSPLLDAMRHGLTNGGKRVRALSVLAAAQLVGGQQSLALQIAAALECIHAYSLIDDDLRRGLPTVHVVYGEAQALLAGDALQTLAFDILARPLLTEHLCASTQVQLIHTLAQASGVAGMAGGQAVDCYHVGQKLPDDVMRNMHQLKTGALLHASVKMGAMCSEVPLSTENAAYLSRFADDLGLLFQVVDDILDASQDTETLGKTAGKDADANKPTYVQAMGLDGARAHAQQLYERALTNLNRIHSHHSNALGVQCLADLAAYCHQRLF